MYILCIYYLSSRSELHKLSQNGLYRNRHSALSTLKLFAKYICLFLRTLQFLFLKNIGLYSQSIYQH